MQAKNDETFAVTIFGQPIEMKFTTHPPYRETEVMIWDKEREKQIIMKMTPLEMRQLSGILQLCIEFTLHSTIRP